MVTERIVYEARDRKRFDKKADCVEHERRLDVVDATMALLGKKRPEYHGDEYVQHSAEVVARFRVEAKRLMDGKHPRELDDGGHPYSRLYYMLMCIDQQNREWGQQWYAAHPNPNAKAVR
jgi:hypothetical protein